MRRKKTLKRKTLFTVCCAWAVCAGAAEYHVSVKGNDTQPGTPAAPLRTIQRAAELARPGDIVTVHEGIYRERVNPPRGGTSDAARITYRAASGEKVVITGSEPVGGWTRVTNDTWRATVPNTLFGAFNPFGDEIRGDWFLPKGRTHHTGAVYLNGHWLAEAASLEQALGPAGPEPLWFGRVEAENTVIHAQFKGCAPNREQVEINVRQTVFYPDQPGRGFITVRGFILRNAATPWAPPTAEQVGLIGTHWSKGWLIESNDVAYSVCSGISLGKYGDRHDNTAQSAKGYVGTIERALAHVIPWTRAEIGGHTVRGNRISHCEQAGIVGSLGCAFSTVTGNVIHDIHVRECFSGHEMAGIKFHGAIDCAISGNRINRTCRGLWLDWMAQGARVSRNVFYDNLREDLFMEVNHGPFLVDNNLLLSFANLLDVSQGGAYAHNLFAGQIACNADLGREMPYHPAHATSIAGLFSIRGGDNRFFNNLFAAPAQRPADGRLGGAYDGCRGYGLYVYDRREYPSLTGGNVYYNNARPYTNETGHAVAAVRARVSAITKEEDVSLTVNLAPATQGAKTAPVTTARLGLARVPQLPYVNPDGSPLAVDRDFFGRRRDAAHPTPGPFEGLGPDDQTLKVW